LESGVLLQVGSEGSGMAFEVGIAERHAHVAEGRTVRVVLAGTLENFDDRAVFAHVDAGGHAGGALVVPELRLHLLLSSYLNESAPYQGDGRNLTGPLRRANSAGTHIDDMNLFPRFPCTGPGKNQPRRPTMGAPTPRCLPCTKAFACPPTTAAPCTFIAGRPSRPGRCC